MSNEDKKELQKKLLNLFKDQEIVDNIIQEVINLYYLNEAELLELEETRPQLEIALENLKTLNTKIEKYLSEVDVVALSKEEGVLSDKLDRLVMMGSIMEGEEEEAIDDIDFLEEVLETSPLPDEEKRVIITEIIKHNLQVYKGGKAKKQEDIVVLQDVPTISAECRAQIDELLSRRDVIERIVRIVNDDYASVIRISGAGIEEQEQITSSLDLAREDMEQTLLEHQDKTPEEALSEFFQKYDETQRHKREFLNRVLVEEEPSFISEEEEQQILQDAFAFQEENLPLISTLTVEEKNKISQWMETIFQDKENRKAIYSSKAYANPQAVEAYAAYEIQIMRELLECVPAEDKETRSKVATRLKNILSQVKETVHEEEKQEIPTGNLFYLVDENGKTTLEEDIEPESNNKGISATYYKEIENQLKAIQNRGKITLISSTPINTGFKAVKKQGVRYTNASRTRVFYIPVGKEDAIIVGANFITGKDSMKEQDLRVRKYADQIELLKERISYPETYEEEVIKSQKVMERLFRNQELESMLQVEAPQDTTGTQK